MTTVNRVRRWYRFIQFRQLWVRILCVISLIFIVLFLSLFFYYQQRAASYDLSIIDKPIGVDTLFSSDNQELGIVGKGNYLIAAREDLPRYLVQALIAREDNDFYEHQGVDYYAFARAFYHNVRDMRYKQGGSTISMQLARNLFELRSRTIDRKLLEIAIATRLEQTLDKEKILTQYFNRIYYGNHTYGVANAARLYFGKKVNELSLVECATLVGLIRGPSIYNPIADIQAAEQVKKETLLAMRRLGFITESELEQAIHTPIVIKRAVEHISPASYPLMVAEAAMRKLEPSLQYDTADMAIKSFFNIDLQRYAETSSEKALEFIEGGGHIPPVWVDIIKESTKDTSENILNSFKKLKPLPSFPRRGDADGRSSLQCAILVLDARKNRKGRILAFTGGRSTVDGINRWDEEMLLGDLAKPFLFSIACQASMVDVNIIANNPVLTGERIGYDIVSTYLKELGLLGDRVEQLEAEKLYSGIYHTPRILVAKRLFSLLYQGIDFPFTFIKGVYTHNRIQVYEKPPKPLEEIIRRESTYVVTNMIPFDVEESEPPSLNVTLPDDEGQWCMRSREHKLAVFVWMGFDHPRPDVASNPLVKKRLAYIAPLLAEQIIEFADLQIVKENKKK